MEKRGGQVIANHAPRVYKTEEPLQTAAISHVSYCTLGPGTSLEDKSISSHEEATQDGVIPLDGCNRGRLWLRRVTVAEWMRVRNIFLNETEPKIYRRKTMDRTMLRTR